MMVKWWWQIKRDGGKKIYGSITKEKGKEKGKGMRERSFEEIRGSRDVRWYFGKIILFS